MGRYLMLEGVLKRVTIHLVFDPRRGQTWGPDSYLTINGDDVRLSDTKPASSYIHGLFHLDTQLGNMDEDNEEGLSCLEGMPFDNANGFPRESSCICFAWRMRRQASCTLDTARITIHSWCETSGKLSCLACTTIVKKGSTSSA